MTLGYSVDYYNNLKYVAFDEQTHVVALTAAIRGLGFKPVAACTYNFPYTDVPSFIQLSQVLESTGVSAYTGAAALIKSSYYLTVAATILDVEALHTSYQRTALGEIPFASPFETVRILRHKIVDDPLLTIFSLLMPTQCSLLRACSSSSAHQATHRFRSPPSRTSPQTVKASHPGSINPRRSLSYTARCLQHRGSSPNLPKAQNLDHPKFIA